MFTLKQLESKFENYYLRIDNMLDQKERSSEISNELGKRALTSKVVRGSPQLPPVHTLMHCLRKYKGRGEL